MCLMPSVTRAFGGGLQDADSMDKTGKKAEGAFYMWSADEIDEVLGTDSERSRVFKQHYYVKPGGNTDLSPRRYAPLPTLPPSEHACTVAPLAWR